LAFSALFVLLPGCALLPEREPAEVSIASLVNEVQRTLDLVKQSREMNAEGLPGFESAEVTLETVGKLSTTNKLEFWVISAKGSVSDARTQTVAFKLVPRCAQPESAASSMPPSDLLARAIVLTARDIGAAVEESSTLSPASLSATIKFVVETTASGGPTIKLTPVTLGTEISHTRSVGNTIKINFSYTKRQPCL
jgi:hypothetical protein